MKDFVTANPHITETALEACGNTPFLILGCDGVWDVLTDDEAVGLILGRYSIHLFTSDCHMSYPIERYISREVLIPICAPMFEKPHLFGGAIVNSIYFATLTFTSIPVYAIANSISLVSFRYESEGPFDDAAKLLVQTAINRGSADNVTAIVIFL